MALEEDNADISDLIKNTHFPLLIRNTCEWPILKWSINDWITQMPQNELPFRCKPLNSISDEPDWERKCPIEMMLFKEFVDKISDENWFYFDYKHMPHWLQKDNEIYKNVLWESFGFPSCDASNSTLWIGSKGAHTPCHQDTYGQNIVVQIFGRKRWLLFPPDSRGLKPTRIPYEESSIYSQLNFASPQDLNLFNGLHKCKSVILEPGEALIVPHKWWHFVENVSEIGISVNMWIPCEGIDDESRLEEVLVRFFVSQISKDLPKDELLKVLNPNEDDLSDMPLTGVIQQVEIALSQYVDYRRQINLEQRYEMNLSHENEITESTSRKKNANNTDITGNVQLVNEITNKELKIILSNNKAKKSETAEETNNTNSGLNNSSKSFDLMSILIDSFCEPSVINLVKKNLIGHLEKINNSSNI